MDFIIERKIDSLGRIVIPKDIRKHLSVESGDEILLTVKDDKVFIEKKNQN